MKKSILGVVVVVALIGGVWLMTKEIKPTDQKIKIGALLPLTGKFANLGEDIKNGLELARKDSKEDKGIDFEIVYEDSAADPKTALPAAQKLITVDQVPFVYGGPGSSGNVAVAPIFEQNKVIFTAISSTPKLNEAGDYIFKVQPDINGEVRRSAQRMFAEGFRKVGLIYDSASDTNVTGRDAFVKIFEELGGKVVAVEGYDSKTVTDFRTILTKLKGKKPDALFFLAIEKVAGTAVKQAREIGLTEQIYGWSPFESEEFFKVAGAFADGVVITGMPFSCEGTVLMKQYCQRYAATYSGRIPLQYSAHAYDVFSILADTVKANEKGLFDPDEIRVALTAHEYVGVSGDLGFDADGNIRDKDFVFRVAKDGRFVDLK